MKSADHHQDEYAEQIKALMGFKSDLGASAVPIPISPN
jgi:type I restriction enzyme R subunit